MQWLSSAIGSKRGVRIAAWGYVTLTIDRFGPRRLKNTCRGGGPSDVIFNAYSALDFLVRQRFIDPRRVVVVGFSQGGWLSLSSVERGTVERSSENKFRAAAAFYPPCTAVKGPMTVPTLILIGESDDWTPADACRKLVNGQDDLEFLDRKPTASQCSSLSIAEPIMRSFKIFRCQPSISDITLSSTN